MSHLARKSLKPRPVPTKKEYISQVETAALIRARLKVVFPAVRFSVRCTGGSSVVVRWTDGPTVKEVQQVTSPFEGSGFDGMIDMSYSKQSWLLPDGSAAFGRSNGTGPSNGSDPGYEYPAPTEGARLVSFGADYVFEERDTTLDEQVGRDLCKLQGVEFVGMRETRHLCGPHDMQDLQTHVWRLLQQTSFPPSYDYKGVKYSDSQDAHVWVELIVEDTTRSENPPKHPETPNPARNDAPGGVVVSEYKGHPTITLPVGKKGFTFGIGKARAVLEYVDEIRSFVEANAA